MLLAWLLPPVEITVQIGLRNFRTIKEKAASVGLSLEQNRKARPISATLYGERSVQHSHHLNILLVRDATSFRYSLSSLYMSVTTANAEASND